MTDNTSFVTTPDQKTSNIDSSISTVRHDFPIFIADNNEITRLQLKAQLESRSDDITLAENGKQALPLLQQNKYQLILLDLQMQCFDSLELLSQIKQADCINNNTPVIAITANTQSHQRKRLIEAGFDDCLIKPILLEQLDKKLDVWWPVESEHSNSYPQKLEHNLIFIEQMLEKTDQNKELASVLFDKLFKELPEQMAIIEQALTHSYLDLAKEITHKLHGSVRFCGFIDLQNAVNQLETDLSDKDAKTALVSFVKLKQKIDHFIDFKDAILQNL